MLTIHRDGSVWDNPEGTMICIPVNMLGVAGAGLAKEAKERSIEWFRAYHAWATSGAPRVGGIHMIYDAHTKFWFASIPTKDHFRDASTIGLVRKSWLDFLQKVPLAKVRRVAVPALGCGLGRLPWSQIYPILRSAEAFFPTIEWRLYTPKELHGDSAHERRARVV